MEKYMGSCLSIGGDTDSRCALLTPLLVPLFEQLPQIEKVKDIESLYNLDKELMKTNISIHTQ